MTVYELRNYLNELIQDNRGTCGFIVSILPKDQGEYQLVAAVQPVDPAKPVLLMFNT